MGKGESEGKLRCEEEKRRGMRRKRQQNTKTVVSVGLLIIQ